jgi:hypothetical protein
MVPRSLRQFIRLSFIAMAKFFIEPMHFVMATKLVAMFMATFRNNPRWCCHQMHDNNDANTN